MHSLTPRGQAFVDQFAGRHELSRESVIHLLEALNQGGGTMAQFHCAEFGSGQWMRGGMTMVGDMFNHSLKARVNDVCSALSSAMGKTEFFSPVTEASGSGVPWWPAGLGTPSSTGSQNRIRYAIFPQSKRLAIEEGGKLTIYDTGDHRIGGISQQQGGATAVQFTSQHGSFLAQGLPVVREKADSPAEVAESSPPPSSSAVDAARLIKQLASLHAEGILTDEEFTAKKGEILRRV
ncbi:SHOCT domain-containing protein [Luteolibacter soli]|uniref:SHOCT domain-containing protein n=1 Tax=Luteolibacter soli TaxID=3135280 RepID=A0ABU9AUV6_9BACT